MKSKDRIKKLITILEDSDINSMEVSSFWGFSKIKLSKTSTPSNNFSHTSETTPTSGNITPSPPAAVSSEASTTNGLDSADVQSVSSNNTNVHIQKAPLVGTVYLSPKPGEDNFISEGGKVSKGDTVCIIEAMKIFNEIESEVSGTVKLINVNNESPVEFGQPIFEIIPD